MGSERAVGPGTLVVMLLGLAVLAFGIGAGIELAGLTRGLALVAAAALVLVFVLVLLRDHRGAPARPPAVPRPLHAPAPSARIGRARAVLEDPAPRTPPRPGSLADERPRSAYALGIAGGAALALTFGGVLFLALPSDWTALTVLLAGVLTWTTVVLLSVRLQGRR